MSSNPAPGIHIFPVISVCMFNDAPELWCPQPPTQWVAGALSPGAKRQGPEADHSPLSIAEVKNGEAIPCNSTIPG
jgi:hypothetical protein